MAGEGKEVEGALQWQGREGGRGQKMNHDVIREQKRARGYSVAKFYSEGRKKGCLGRNLGATLCDTPETGLLLNAVSTKKLCPVRENDRRKGKTL